MVSKPLSPGPNPTTTPAAKPTRSRKAAVQDQTEPGRAGSAGGVMLAKEQGAKTPSTPKPTTKAATPLAKDAAAKVAAPEASSTADKPRRKPRKLNKDPTPSSAQNVASTPAGGDSTVEAASELEALKSRVRGLEAKVEELYKSSAEPRPQRSPRRRGKGRKGSSSTQVPTLNTTANNRAKVEEVEDEEEEADEELVRLEGELETARQDLELFRPRGRRTMSQETEDVEEIPRGAPGVRNTTTTGDKQVTLSGSYRIPIPANVSVDDVKTIKSGVSAAQNVARSFLEQRRAAAALRAEQNPSPQPTTTSSRTAKAPKPKATSSSMEVAVADDGGKQSWGEWIGGYSMAITRAVSKIEHEAAMESQKAGPASVSAPRRPAQAERRTSVPTMRKTGGKRPPAKAKLSSEQVHGLMS